MSGNRIKNVDVHFWVTPQMDTSIRKIADGKGISVSAAYREILELGLVAGGYQSGAQNMAGMIREAVTSVLQPQVERLAAISAKGTQISAASFFLSVYNGRQILQDWQIPEYNDLADQARKLGVEYLKVKDKRLDDFISSAHDRMEATG